MFSGAVTADGTSVVHGSDMWEWVTCLVSMLCSGTKIIINCFDRSRGDFSGRSAKRFVQSGCSVYCKTPTRVKATANSTATRSGKTGGRPVFC